MHPDQENLHKRLVQALENAEEEVLVSTLKEARAADIAESLELLDDE